MKKGNEARSASARRLQDERRLSRTHQRLCKLDGERSDLVLELGHERSRGVGERIEIDLVRQLEELCERAGKSAHRSVVAFGGQEAAVGRGKARSAAKRGARASVP